MFKIFIRNERVEKEVATRHDILPFFGQGNFIFIRKKSRSFSEGCLWYRVALLVYTRLCCKLKNTVEKS